MAQLLYERHSTAIHLNVAKRHMRLCKQFNGTENLVSSIEPVFEALQKKEAATVQATFEKEAATDFAGLNDNNLDDKIKTCFERCKQYDRENPGRPVLLVVFPDNKHTTITRASLDSEPDMAEQMVARLESLGATHPLNELAAGLKESISKCREALTAYNERIRLLKVAEADEKIAKSNLRKQYEFNYYDSVKLFGKIFAERLFPPINGASKKKSNGEDEVNTPIEETNKTSN
jgi:hypothetical protein